MNENAPPTDIDSLEAAFPIASGVAFSQARSEALKAGLSVMQSENGSIYQIFPDGTRKLLKQIPPATKLPAGTKFKLP